jgi:hypothetical protein
MTSQGGPYTRFRRALAAGDMLQVRAAAAELPAVPLDDALDVCLLVHGAEPGRFDAAAVRWLGRFALERARSVGELRQAVAAFERLPRAPDESVAVLRRLAGH